MNRLLILSCLFLSLIISSASAQPDLPPGFDVGANSVRGGETGERITLQITPYNAGRKLFENELFTVYERINFLSSDVSAYGDPLCTVTNPGDKYQYYSSRMVIVMNMSRDEPITRRKLWDEVRPALSKIVLNECPEAHSASANVFIRGWDVAANGAAYLPEAIPLPRVQLEPVKPSDLNGGYNFRNTRAFEAINGIVSEGILSVYFAFAPGKNKPCRGVGCAFETFAPIYWGAPDRMLVSQLTSGSLTAGMASQRDAMRRQRDKVIVEYDQRYTTFNGYLAGVAHRIQRDKYVRKEKALRYKTMQAFYKAMNEASKVIEKEGLGPSFFKWIAGSGGSSNTTLCSARKNSVMNSCTEDFLLLVY